MPNSRKFAFDFAWSALEEEGAEESLRGCDFPNCSHFGEYPAPKSPKRLQDRFYFCLDHVRDYNASWNFYGGMSTEETDYFNAQDSVGWRPSWAFGHSSGAHARLRDRLGIFAQFGAERIFEDDDSQETYKNGASNGLKSNWFAPKTAEEKAVVLLDLDVPFGLEELKGAYKAKAKVCHPDVNPDDPNAIHRFREVKEAFDLLQKVLNSVF